MGGNSSAGATDGDVQPSQDEINGGQVWNNGFMGRGKKKRERLKRIKRAIGRLSAPPPRVIEDKRGKLRRKADERDSGG